MKWTWYADLGNCTLHWAARTAQRWQATGRLSVAALGTPEALATIKEELSRADLTPGDCQEAVLCVSSPARESAVADVVGDVLPGAIKILGVDFHADFPTEYHDPAQVGADRLANVLGAVQACGTPVVVVDFGSCLTVDAISATGVFLGGAIAPGLPSIRKGLAEIAHIRGAVQQALEPAALPTQPPGHSTAECLALGIYYGLAGSADRLAAIMRQHVGISAPVIATGGDATRLAPLCDTEMTVGQMLTLNGLRIAYERSQLAVGGVTRHRSASEDT